MELRPLGRPWKRGKDNIKIDLGKQGLMMTGVMWFKTGTTGGFLRAGNETSGSGP
jgi:uncharacterized protein YaaQ